jgi:hypothetical protein
VQDDGGTANGGADLDATARVMTIAVTPVNDAPAGTDNTLTIALRAAYHFTLRDFGFTDPTDSPADALAAVTITTVPDAGRLTLAGAPISDGERVTASDIASGSLVFTPAADAAAGDSAAFTFQVRDDGGNANGGVNADATPRAMTFRLIPAAPAPSNPGADPIVASPPAPLPAPNPPPGQAVILSTVTGGDSHAAAASSPVLNASLPAVVTTGGMPAEPGWATDAGDFVSSRTAETARLFLQQAAPASRAQNQLRAAASFEKPDLAPVLPPYMFELNPTAISMDLAPGTGAGSGFRLAVAPDAASTGEEQEHSLVTSATSVRLTGIVMSVGLVTWALRGAGLLTSLLTSIPAWRHLDPLPVLAPEEDKPDWGDQEDDDSAREEDAVNRMWGGKQNRQAKD